MSHRIIGGRERIRPFTELVLDGETLRGEILQSRKIAEGSRGFTIHQRKDTQKLFIGAKNTILMVRIFNLICIHGAITAQITVARLGEIFAESIELFGFDEWGKIARFLDQHECA